MSERTPVILAALLFAAAIIGMAALVLRPDGRSAADRDRRLARENVLLAMEIGYLCHQKSIPLEECKSSLRTSAK